MLEFGLKFTQFLSAKKFILFKWREFFCEFIKKFTQFQKICKHKPKSHRKSGLQSQKC